MKAMMIDTLALSNKMVSVGMPKEQAQIYTETLVAIVDNFPTKDELKNELKQLELKTDNKLSTLKVDMIKWVIGISAAQATLLISVIVGMFKFFSS